MLIAIGFAVYTSNLHNKLFWDDDDWIISNPFVHNFSHLKEIFSKDILSGFGLGSNYYRPLLLVSFAFNYVLDGVKPLGYHLVSNDFHIANGVLIFLILFYVFKKKLPAFLAALLFLIHPLQTEAVTYISGRGDPMSVFFMLLALWFFIRSQVRPGAMAYYLLALASFALAILSRETAVLLPVLLVIFYVSFLDTKPDNDNQANFSFFRKFKHALIKTWPYWVLTAVYAMLRLTILNFQNTLNFYSESNEYTRHLSYRLYTFGHALIEYFKLILVPLGLHMEREISVNTSILEWPVWLCVLIVAVIIYCGFVLYKKEQKFQSKIWFFSWSWFFVALAPVSGIVPINALIYEHWLYLPLIGLFTLAGFYLDKLLDFLIIKKWILARALVVAVLVSYFSFFAIASFKRNVAWSDPVKFYQDILKYNPLSIRILNNLANYYAGNGELDKAIETYQKAVTGPQGDSFAQPHYNLANLYRDKGNIDLAIQEYKKAIQVDPSFPFSYQNLAVIYAGRGELEGAAAMLEILKKLKPLEPKIYYNLGLIYAALNKINLALDNLQKGTGLSSGDPQTASAISSLLKKIQGK